MDETSHTPSSQEPPQPSPPPQPLNWQTPPLSQVPPPWGYASPPPPAPARLSPGRRARKLVVGLGVAAGVALAASAVAVAATSSSPGGPSALASTQASSGSSNAPATPPEPGPGMPGLRRGFGFFGIGGGPLLYGTFTVQGPNGPETLAVRTGTVSDISNTSGSTWTLTVKSTDGTSGTFTVDSQTSVNGGESGIASVKQGDTVRVVAVVSGSTSTAKQVIDETVLKANGSSWLPMGPKPSVSNGPSGTSTQSEVPPV